ncbi:MAG: MFS transporter [Armatimonadetes bacterium]|nr:MFS transporter [Armatimonadota bacterium]
MRRFGLLFLLMFLEFAIWGAWLPVAQTYFQGQVPAGLGFNGTQLGILFALMPACSIFMAPLFGQLADRVFNSERLLATLHLLSAVTLFAMSRQTTFTGTLVCLLIHCLLFSPTVALCTSVVMHHLDDPATQFGNVRVAGTIGWMVSGWVLGFWRVSGRFQTPGDLFVMASVLSLILGIVCFFIPRTPPSKAAADGDRFAFGAALKLMNNTNFMMLMIIAFVICTQFDFFYMFTPGFLTSPTQETLSRILPSSYQGVGGAGLGILPQKVSFYMSFAQMSEVILMLSLPFLIKRLGYKWTIYLGILAWFLRFAIYVFLPTLLGAIIAILLHGFCIACFLIGGSIYVAKVAPDNIRASAQALYAIVTFGFGRVIGSILGGQIENMNTTVLPVRLPLPGMSDLEKLINWQAVFAVPAGMTLVCALAFPLLFRLKKGELD